MKSVLHLECLICGKQYPPHEVEYVCPDHGKEGILDVKYDYDRIGQGFRKEDLKASSVFTMWRYRPLLPVEVNSEPPPLRVGWTPLYPTPGLARVLGMQHLWIKDEGLQPTASLKDRASAMASVKAREAGNDTLTTASTGNAAAALSGICASTGQNTVIFVPEAAPKAKLAQIQAFGAQLVLVQGVYDDAYDLCHEAATEFGWYNRNTGFNPYMSEGKKTVSLEICEQLQWQAPDVILVSVGDGCIIGGVHKGLVDLYELGWIDRMPRLIGVQSTGSNFIAQAWKNGEDVLTKAPIEARTLADSISAGLPRDRKKALRAVKETQGAYIEVTDEEILAAIPLLSMHSGVFAEPAGAASVAGLVKALEMGLVDPSERVVCLNTGSGLKDIVGVQRGVDMGLARAPIHIPPDFGSLKKALNSNENNN